MAPVDIERVDSERDRHQSWWERYATAIERGGLSYAARKVIRLDAHYILSQGILGAGEAGLQGSDWPVGRLRRGLVMGSVQSGKTASMLGVTAKSMDAGIDIIVILAGTRLALWRQTIERAVNQLDFDGGRERIDSASLGAVIPRPKWILGSSSSVGLENLYNLPRAEFKQNLRMNRPIIAMAMKHSSHILRLARVIEAGVRRSESLSRPIHLLVIDDEADDGSILDAAKEARFASDSEQYKQIPRHIARLWAGGGRPAETFSENLYATYLAYTATPQANILQCDHNPLSPRDFVVALRTPGRMGSVKRPRDVSYHEPAGLSAYYTGGAYFYSGDPEAPESITRVYPWPERSDDVSEDDYDRAVQTRADQMLGDALRNFFVAGAMRLLIERKRLSDVVDRGFETQAALGAKSPSPHTMLFHPSAKILEHVAGAKLISAWSNGSDAPSTELGNEHTDENGWPVLSREGLRSRLRAEPEAWKSCWKGFLESWNQLAVKPGGFKPEGIAEITWEEIEAMLRDEIFEYVRLSIINSDEDADDRPEFAPLYDSSGKWKPPRDLLTIFVSGNVMSRGLTLEGLTTTIFSRTSNTPVADTQMQMQRWFGYRGKHLGFCRVFLFEDQYERFRHYHLNDEALRREIIAKMNADQGRAPSPLVLQGADFRATGKVSNVRSLPLCPGALPFVRKLGRGSAGEQNIDLLVSSLESRAWEKLTVRQIERGLISREPVTLLDAAQLLEEFRYHDHAPDPASDNHRRWSSYAAQIGLEEPDAPLFRPPTHEDHHIDDVFPTQCPYSIAAYFRLWETLLNRRVPGFFPTDQPDLPWGSIDLARYRELAPSFYLGVRFGDAGEARDGRLQTHGVRRVRREIDGDRVVATWGSRNPGEGEHAYLGDHMFDYHHSGFTPPVHSSGEAPWRPVGHPGLILFHVIKGAEQDYVTVGVAIPLGGPDHFAAIRSTR